jgi:hypothetical protein
MPEIDLHLLSDPELRRDAVLTAMAMLTALHDPEIETGEAKVIAEVLDAYLRDGDGTCEGAVWRLAELALAQAQVAQMAGMTGYMLGRDVALEMGARSAATPEMAMPVLLPILADAVENGLLPG